MNYIVKMLRKPEVAELAGDKVMIDFISGNYYMLKGTANDIWDMLNDGISSQSIAENLMNTYEVDADTCKKAVDKFLHEIMERGFIELVEE